MKFILYSSLLLLLSNLSSPDLCSAEGVVCLSKDKLLVIRGKKCRKSDQIASIENLSLNSVQGPKGETGPQGPKGETGETGSQGVSGTNGVSSRTLEETSTSVSVAANSSSANFVTCSGVKKPLGGGCESSNSNLVVYYSQPGDTQSFFSWFCGFKNITGSTVNATITAHAVCGIAN